MECMSYTSSPLTCTQFHVVFLEKYVPRTLRDRKKDDFIALEQGCIVMAACEAKSHAFFIFCVVSDYIGREDQIIYLDMEF